MSKSKKSLKKKTTAVDEARLAEAQAADAEIRRLAEQGRKLSIPIEAELDQLLAGAKEIDRKLEHLEGMGFLSETGVETFRALFRTFVRSATSVHLHQAFDLGPEEHDALQGLNDSLEREAESVREIEAEERRAAARGVASG